MSRRDQIVLRSCAALLLVDAVPLVVLGAATRAPAAMGDAVLLALSPPALLGVVGFGVALAAALSSPGLEPVAAAWAEAEVTAAPGSRTALPRLRWALVATLSALGAYAAAVLLDGGVRAGFVAFEESLDDGSAMWAFVVLLVRGLVVDLRGVIAFVVALVALRVARRPVRRADPPGRAARTTRWSPGRPPG